MLNFALAVFATTAIVGLILAASVMRDRLPPWALSLVHALLGATGLLLLIASIIQGPAPKVLITAFVVLLSAAIGGFVLAAFHVRHKTAPNTLVMAHAGLAICGFAILVSLAL